MKTTWSGALKRISSLPAVDSAAPFVNSSVNWRSGSFTHGWLLRLYYTSPVLSNLGYK